MSEMNRAEFDEKMKRSNIASATSAYRNASSATERERALQRLREFGFESLRAADRYLRMSWRRTMPWKP
jgi:hypothetical protein